MPIKKSLSLLPDTVERLEEPRPLSVSPMILRAKQGLWMGNACPSYSRDPLLLCWALEGLTLAE